MKLRFALAGAALIALLVLASPSVQACGVSASGVASCSLAEHEEAIRPRWAVGVSGLYTSTRLRFSGSVYADQVRAATLASLAYLPTPKLVLQTGVGVAFGGALRLGGDTHNFSPGPTASIGADFRAFDDGRYFLLLTSGLSFAMARTQLAAEPSVGYEAFDLRLGTQFGVQLARILSPYATARVFGGPVYWRYAGRAVTGTDTHHYQLGVGVGVRASRTVLMFAEGIPLGERAVSLGVALAL
jgi:hypothetical protein